MKVQEYIAELLFDYNRLIIPNFGAFIGTPRSAKIDSENNIIQPPSKDILFNDKLTINDELLITKIAENERIVKQAAVEKMKLFVSDLKEELAKEGKVHFDKLGSFVQKPSGEIVFNQDENVNFLNDAYGLNHVDLPKEKIESIITPIVETPVEESVENEQEQIKETSFEEEAIADAVLEENIVEEIPEEEIKEDKNIEVIEAAETETIEKTEEKLEEETVAIEPEKEKVSAETNKVVAEVNNDEGGFKWWFVALPILALLIGGFFVWQLISKDSKNPYAKKDSNTPIKQKQVKTAQTPILTDSSETEKTNKTNEENVKAAVKNENTKPATTKVVESTKPKNTNTTSSTNNSQSVTNSFDPVRGYYIVIGSIKGKSTAENDAGKWKKKGYEAHVLPGPNGYNRIGLYVGKDKNEATNQLAKYKSEIISSAWLLQN